MAKYKKENMSSRGDESMFGFPKNCMVKDYPKSPMSGVATGPEDYGIMGVDDQERADTMKLTADKSKSRF